MYDTPLTNTEEEDTSNNLLYKQPLSFNWKVWVVVGLLSLIVFVGVYWLMNAFVFSPKTTTVVVISPRRARHQVYPVRIPRSLPQPTGPPPVSAPASAGPTTTKVEHLIKSNWGKINSALQEV